MSSSHCYNIKAVQKNIKQGRKFWTENKDLKIGVGKNIKLKGTLYAPAARGCEEGGVVPQLYIPHHLPVKQCSVADLVLAKFGSRALKPERWEIFKTLLNEYSR